MRVDIVGPAGLTAVANGRVIDITLPLTTAPPSPPVPPVPPDPDDEITAGANLGAS